MNKQYSEEYQKAQVEALKAWLKMSPNNHIICCGRNDNYTAYQCAGYGGELKWEVDIYYRILTHNSYIEVLSQYDQELHDITIEPENNHFYHKDHSWEAEKVAAKNLQNREHNLRRRRKKKVQNRE